MEKKSLYYNLVLAQTNSEKENIQDQDLAEDIKSLELPTTLYGSINNNLTKTMSIDPKEEHPPVDFFRVMKMNMVEWPYITLGILASIVMGGAMPVYAILFGEVLGVLKLSPDQAREDSVYYCGLFVACGVTAGKIIKYYILRTVSYEGLATFMQIAMFAAAGEHLTQRMRIATFSAMLRQEMGWFDNLDNSVGSLLSRLSADTGAIQGATGARIGALLHAMFTLVLSITTSLVLEWRLGLVGCVFIPIVLMATVFQHRMLAGHDHVEKKSLQNASRLAVEAISNIRTVVSLRKEAHFIEEYNKSLANTLQSTVKRSLVRGLVFGFAQSVPFFAYSGCMFYGGYLVYSEDLDYKKVFKVAEALILGTMMVGTATAFAPNYNRVNIVYCISSSCHNISRQCPGHPRSHEDLHAPGQKAPY